MSEDGNYLKHIIFNQLTKYAKFYEDLAYSIFPFIAQGTRSILNLDTSQFSSIQGTLESIRVILINKRINDAYTLLRKYYDSIIINIYTSLYLDDHFSIDNFIVKKIEGWRAGTEKLPRFSEMRKYIQDSDKLTDINDLLNTTDSIYQQLRDRLNNHVHYNYYRYVLLNDKNLYIPERQKILNVFNMDLCSLFVMHFSYLFFLNEHYMIASDYVDSLDVGLVPEENSEYFVAPFIQEIFDSEIKIRRPDLAEAIKKKTKMMLN